jgi:hypothetical protein
MNPYKLVRREQGYEPTIGTPCVSESFFRHSYPIVHGNSLTLAQVVDVVHEDREAVLASTRLMKEKVAQTVKERRRDYERDSSRLDEMMPPEVDTLISVCRNYSPKDRYQQLGEHEIPCRPNRNSCRETQVPRADSHLSKAQHQQLDLSKEKQEKL